ncbi:MAG TPA: acyl-CoA dehydrogenase family protein, partial [Blastocatellia bacterium]
SGREEKKLGIDGSSTTALMLEDCQVPVENVLGEIGRGHKIAFNVLNIGRLKLGARSVGAIKLSLGQSVSYAKERHQFGQPIANFGLIKHKLAEMAIRAYVGESILYRTAGMIDQALESVNKDDPQRVLAVLEQYAGECSIIKVWVSEALGYVVDEEVQVFGGYGYSKDYPAERAYRDARIARIYEGTSEINRIVIGSQLLRRARSGDLGILAGAVSVSGAGREGTLGPLADERKILGDAKRVALASFGLVDKAYGDGFRDQQEILGHIADIVVDIYTMESALLRTEALIGQRGEAQSRVQTDITRVYIRDAAARIERAASVIENEISVEGDSIVTGRMHQAPIQAIAARRRIADSMITAGRYNL